MKIYKTQKEVEADIIDGILRINGDVKFECNISIEANISARDISAWNITARDITASDISAGNISARDITASDISAGNISALKITARDITARDISAWNISAGNINYYAHCISYQNIQCKRIAGRRINSFHRCLDGELIILPEKRTISIDGKDIEISEESYQAFKKQFQGERK